MKHSIRRLAALLLALALVAAACGDDDDAGTTAATTATTAGATTTAAPGTTVAAGSLDEYLVTAGTLTLVTTGNFPPFTRINQSTGAVEGYSLDVGAEVAQRLGLEFATPTVDFVAELEGLQAGLYDIADSGIWPTPARQDAGFAFSRPMTSAGFIALVTTANAGTLSGGLGMNMAGLKVGAIQGSIHEQWTIENEAALGYDEYVPFQGAAEIFTGVKQGRIEIAVSDSVLASFNALNDDELEVTGPTINAHPLSMTFRQESQPLIDAINPVLDAMLADGTLAEIQLKWFGRCLAVPNDINEAPPYDQLPAGCPADEPMAMNLDEYLVTPGTLTLVTTGNFPPFTRINQSTGDVEGYSLDVGAAVAERLGLEFATPTVDFVAELEGLQAGLYDIADSGIWPTPARQDAGFAFSRPMTSAGFIALVTTANAATLAGGLDMNMAGLKVGAIQGSIHEQWTIENEAALGYDEYVPFQGAAEIFTGVKQGRIEIAVSDSVLASFNALNDDELEVTGPTINAHPLSMTFRQESQPLIDAINPVLDAMLADGTLAEIQLKWFGRCLAVPNDINEAPPYDQLPTGC